MKAAKILAFIAAALLALPVGCAAALFLSALIYHRYEVANTGYYHGIVRGDFFGSVGNSICSLRFRGESEPRWYWRAPTNFSYPNLDLTWFTSTGQKASVALPSLTYRFADQTGILTKAVLAEWLLDDDSRTATNAAAVVNTMFGLIQDAGHGALPPPRHHGHHLKEPLNGSIQHFLIGVGVTGLVYAWIVVWLILVVVFGRKFFRKQPSAT